MQKDEHSSHHVNVSFFSSVRDFDHFTDRNFVGLLWDKGTSYNDWIWRSNLFTLKGGHNWRLVRQTLNPIFTLSKMKVMYEASIIKFTKTLHEIF